MESTNSQPHAVVGAIDGGPAVTSLATKGAMSRGFLIVLALVTLIPLLGVPLYFVIQGGFFPGSLTVLAITGPMHVASTAFFYFDRAFWPIIRENPLRSVWSLAWAPLGVLAAGLAIAATIGRPWAYMLVLTFQNGWLFYHYQRQNFGLLSFISTNAGCGRVPTEVNTALNVAALAALISMLGVPGFCLETEGIVTPRAAQAMWYVSVALYALSMVLMTSVVYREPRLRQNAWLTAGLILGIAFFLPAILFRSLALGFLPYAIAHGAQYILMMSVLSGRSSRGWMALLTMCALGVTIGLSIDLMRAWPVILLYTGIVQVHFLLDAKFWRLREPQQRAIMNDRFDFLLAH
jgi:hypothetical protein